MRRFDVFDASASTGPGSWRLTHVADTLVAGGASGPATVRVTRPATNWGAHVHFARRVTDTLGGVGARRARFSTRLTTSRRRVAEISSAVARTRTRLAARWRGGVPACSLEALQGTCALPSQARITQDKVLGTRLLFTTVFARSTGAVWMTGVSHSAFGDARHTYPGTTRLHQTSRIVGLAFPGSALHREITTVAHRDNAFDDIFTSLYLADHVVFVTGATLEKTQPPTKAFRASLAVVRHNSALDRRFCITKRIRNE